MKETLKKIPLLKTAVSAIRARHKNSENIKRIRYMIKTQPKLRVVVGASGIFDDGWIDTDIEYLNLLKKADWKKCFVNKRLDSILAEHVWEHLTPEEGLVAAKNCFNYLKAGGYLRVAVPDGFHPSEEYISHVEVGVDGHKALYNYKSFSKLFETAGFDVKLREYYDDNGEFHYIDWDPLEGKIHRSKRFDNREQSYKYTSLIIDAVKK